MKRIPSDYSHNPRVQSLATHVWTETRFWELASRLCERWEPRAGGSFDRKVLQLSSLRLQGRPLQIENPSSYVDKLSWLKLFHGNPLLNIASDKVAARDFVAFKGLSHLLVPDARVFKRPRDIPWSELGDSFVAKPNHGSQMVLFCPDRSKLDTGYASRRLWRWLGRNYSIRHAETNYRGIRRKILIEPYLGRETGLVEYKVNCFEGRPRHIFTILSRENGVLVRSKTDPDWNPLPRTSTGTQIIEVDTPRPAHLDAMLHYVQVLCQDFIVVRVDFLFANSHLYFSELTFFSQAGINPRINDEADRSAAARFDLSNSDAYTNNGHAVLAKLTEWRATSSDSMREEQ